MALWRRGTGGPHHPDDVRMSFGEHLEELRTRIIRLLLGGLVGMIACFVFRDVMMMWILWPLDLALAYHDLPREIVTLDPTENFVVVMKMSIYCGLILTAPFGLYQLWAFVAAGLYGHEQRFVRQFFPISVVLFAAGVMFCFTIVLPLVFTFLIGIRTWIPSPDAQDNFMTRLLLARSPTSQPTTTSPASPTSLPFLDEDPIDPASGQAWINPDRGEFRVSMPDGVYVVPLRKQTEKAFSRPQLALSQTVDFVTRLALGFGIGFQVPIVVVLLAMVGIASVSTMASVRRYVVLGMVAGAAIVTPPDVTSQILLAVPMWLLFEGGLIAARLVVRRRQEEIQQAENE